MTKCEKMGLVFMILGVVGFLATPIDPSNAFDQKMMSFLSLVVGAFFFLI